MKTMNKKLAVLLVAALLVTMFAGCAAKKTENEPTAVPTQAPVENNDATSDQNTEPTAEPTQAPAAKLDINVAALKGPTSLGMLKLMQDSEDGTAANNYNFTIAGAADEITAGIIKGEFSLAAVPCNLASVLYNKSNGGVTLLAINTLSVLYIVETGNEINSVADLKGKTIYSTGKGTTPEYTLRHLLKSAGIDPDKDVTMEYKSEATEVAAILAEADNAIAMLPQPFVTTAMMQNDRIRIALDVNAEWGKLDNGNTVVTGVLVANTKFLNENKEAVLAFLDEYKASTSYTVEQVDEAAALAEKFGIIKAAVAKKAIPYCSISFIDGADMKTKVSAYLNVLYTENPSAVGGNMPGDEFYFQR